MAELSVQIAGLRTDILTADPEVAAVVRERYKGFLSPGARGWRIEMKTEAPRGPVYGGDVQVRRDGGGAQFAVRRGDFAGTLDLGDRSGIVTLAEAHEASIDSFMRIAYSLGLLDVSGLVLHAASLVRHGQAYVFSGRSGSGKTTISRLSPTATLLSDELSIVRVSAEGPRCHGTPFWGDFARAGEDRAAPLAGVYFLHHSDGHSVRAMGPRQALERLLPNVVFFCREADLIARVLNIAAAVVETVPCFDLFFRRDPGFWEVIEGG